MRVWAALLLFPLAAAPAEVSIPGGREALAIIAQGNEKSPPDRFLIDYCRAILQNTNPGPAVARAYQARIRAHFRRVRALEGFASRSGGPLRITLSRGDRASSTRTDRVLNLLGWKFHASGQRANVEADEKTRQGRRQEAALALAIDGVGLQEALEAGKPFSFDLVHEVVPTVAEEPAWLGVFFPGEELPGGFAEALARDTRLARLYLGLSALDGRTRAALVATIGLRDLAERHAALLQHYSSALALEGPRVAVPGGEPAEPFWEKLAGASPQQPGAFLRALMGTDGGRLLAFFFGLAMLDAAHQRYSTRSAARLTRLYGLFRDAPEMAPGVGRPMHRIPLLGFLREAPLDPAGRVKWPGGLGAWMAQQNTALEADAEDELVERLVRSRYEYERSVHSELENLVAVMRIDAHRAEPLDEASARLLAQRFAEYEEAYPYFTTLTELSHREFEAFFRAGERLRRLPLQKLNAALGTWHALIELLCLARQSGKLGTAEAAALFVRLNERFAAESDADLTRAALDSLTGFLAAAGARGDPDEAVREALLGRAAPVQFQFGGAARQADPSKRRHEAFRRVLEQQKVPTLAAILAVYGAARTLAEGRGDAQQAQALETGLRALPAAERPAGVRLSVHERRNLESADPARLLRLSDEIRRKLAAGERAGAARLANELLGELNAQVKLALAGLIYAYYLRPEDLLVAEDPLLLRKHQFVPFTSFRPDSIILPSDLSVGGSAGSHLVGGFAGFNLAAARVAAAGRRLDPRGEAMFYAQVAAARSAAAPLDIDGLRRIALSVRAGREWVERAGADDAARSELAEATRGLLSFSRRAALLDAIAARDWSAAWRALTLSDLYFLGPSRLGARGGGLDEAGAPSRVALGCPHLHLMRRAPYEEAERYMHLEPVAERTAELRLYLADTLGRAGLPAALLGALVEPVAQNVFRELRMSDVRDWQSVLAAFTGLNEDLVEDALGAL